MSLKEELVATVAKHASVLYGATWVSDNEIVFPNAGTLWAVTLRSGEPRRLSTLAGDEQMHVWPSALPSGAAVIAKPFVPSSTSLWRTSGQARCDRQDEGSTFCCTVQPVV